MFTIDQRFKPKGYKGQPVRWAHEKKNGHRATVIVLPAPDDRLRVIPADVERDLMPAIDVNQLELADLLSGVPGGTALDGELYIPGHPATDVPTTLTANAADLPPLQFAPFAAPWFDGDDIRDWPLPKVQSMLEGIGFGCPRLYDIGAVMTTTELAIKRVEIAQEDIEGLCLRLAREKKWEGFVVKNQHYAEWYKIKPESTCDCVVMDITRSTSLTKYGSMKALIVGCYAPNGNLVKVANVGKGFTDEEREEIIRNRAKYLGRVCEVGYQEVSSGMLLGFSKFLRWRDDKPAKECLLSQITE